MGLRLMCAAGVALVALLLLLTAAILRLVLLLVQLVSLKYSLAVCTFALVVWFVNSRRQCYAKGFYSCSRVPQAAAPKQKRREAQPEEEKDDREEKYEPQQLQETASVVLPVAIKKGATAPPSETESEDDDSEGSGVSSIHKTPASSCSRHNQSLADVRMRSHTTDGELQRRQATRPRSSSAVGDSRSSQAATRAGVARSHAERKRKLSRRRAHTGVASSSKHAERSSRRATFASKQETLTSSNRSNSEMLEDALRSDGYWIGDFSVQRRLVSRRGHATSPKSN